MKSYIRSMFVGILLVFLPVFALSAPIINLKTDYYFVKGTSANEIRNDLNMKSPVHQEGVTYDARTNWFVKWNFWWNESNGQCTITKVKTTVDVQYVMPKLSNERTLTQSLRQKWGAYIVALSKHEEGHKDFGVRAANEIEYEIGNLAAQSSCKQLEVKANQLANKILRKFIEDEKEFDRRTNHGMNEMAVFP